MNKEDKVKMLLDEISNLKNIPTKKDNSIDMEKFYEVPEIKAVITLLKNLNVNNEYLNKNGFAVAYMLLGQKLR